MVFTDQATRAIEGITAAIRAHVRGDKRAALRAILDCDDAICQMRNIYLNPAFSEEAPEGGGEVVPLKRKVA